MTTSLLANRAYRRLFLAQCISLAGTGVTTIALALLAWDMAGSSAGEVLGIALALKMVVYVTLAPVMGAVAERLPRRAWLVSLDLVRVGVVLALPFVTQVWQIYVLVVLLNACAAGFTPVYQATIPDVVGSEVAYQKALSWAQVASSLEQILSPALAGLLLLVMPYTTLFVLDAASFVVSALLILGVAMAAPRTATRSRPILHNLGYGIVGYLRTPRLRAVFAMYFAVAAASAMVIVNTVVYVRDFLNMTDAEVAWATTLAGIGSVIGALMVPPLTDRYGERYVMLAGTILLVTAMFTGGLITGYAVLLALWCFVGIGLSLVQTPVGLLVRRSCPPEDSTAYFAANFSLSHLCWLVAYPMVGFASTAIGVINSFFLAGATSLAALLTAALIFPQADEFNLASQTD